MPFSSCVTPASFVPSADGNDPAESIFVTEPDDAVLGGNFTQASAYLGEMAGGLAHDFRNILAVIGSALRLAQRRCEDPDRLNEILNAARDCVERGVTMTSDLLAFAQRREERSQPQNLNEILVRLKKILELAVGPGISIVLDLDRTVPMRELDRARFEAAILNLVINARDAMPQGGKIRIGTSLIDEAAACWSNTGQVIRVRIKDEGSGMPDEVRYRIFEPYFTTKPRSGTGLGLPLVSAFAERSGGKVAVQSAAGKGTIVDLLLPVATDPSKTSADLWRQIDRWINEGGAGRAAHHCNLERET